jgi:hypothetical protein
MMDTTTGQIFRRRGPPPDGVPEAGGCHTAAGPICHALDVSCGAGAVGWAASLRQAGGSGIDGGMGALVGSGMGIAGVNGGS